MEALFNNPILVNETLVSLRKYYGLSRQEVANRSNISLSSISRYESKQGEPSLRDCRILADAFHVDVRDLLFPSEEFKTKISNPRNAEKIHELKREIKASKANLKRLENRLAKMSVRGI